MGKRDDWCSSKGLANRKKGMYEKESRCRKFSYCMCFGFSALFFFSAGGLYASRASNAAKINSDYAMEKLLSGTAPLVQKCELRARRMNHESESADFNEFLAAFEEDFSAL